MDLGLYSEGDPTDPGTWSRTPYEMVSEFESQGVSVNTHDVTPSSKYGPLAHLPYFNLRNLTSNRKHHPRYRRAVQSEARRIETGDDSDVILSIGDVANFRSPYYIYQDLDVNTIIDWRASGRSTYSFDKYPIDLLEKREEFQCELYEGSDGIIVSSDWVAENIRSYVDEPEKVHSLGLGHRYDIIKPAESQISSRYDKKKVLFVGKDGYRKGLDILLEGFLKALEDYPSMQLTIVTDETNLSADLRNRCHEAPNTTVYDGVSLERLTSMYAEHSIFVMPSKFEAWGKVFFEAMSFGLPVVGSDHCAMPEFIVDEHNGFTASLSPESVRNAILATFRNYDTYRELSLNSVSVADEYTWDSVINRIVDVMGVK